MAITKRVLILVLILLCSISSVCATELENEFVTQLSKLQTPMQQALTNKELTIRVNEEVYAPFVAPIITPFDKLETVPAVVVQGTFNSSDENIFTVNKEGKLKGISNGEATLVYQNGNESMELKIIVDENAIPHAVQNNLWLINNEFLTVERKRLDRSNKYTKWYYKSSKAVGWCSVFIIYSANASGNPPIPEEDLNESYKDKVFYLQEGQVGNQYDGYNSLDRFVAVPKPGYLVVYADMSKAYRTTHIATVTDVVEVGNGIYDVTTIEGNMSNTVKKYTYRYDSTKSNNHIGIEDRNDLQWNMQEIPKENQVDPLVQYTLHTDHWSVFGFCATW